MLTYSFTPFQGKVPSHPLKGLRLQQIILQRGALIRYLSTVCLTVHLSCAKRKSV